METLKNIRLHAVVTISPFDFDKEIYPFKERVSEERVDQYWKSILEEYGLGKLEAFRKGWHYVKADTMDEESLSNLIQHYLKNYAEESSEEDSERGLPLQLPENVRPAAFCGGVILTAGDRILVTPQCCVGLEDHVEWSRIQPSEDFQHIWIGHPWMYYKTLEDKIFFTRLIEKDFDGKTWKHYTKADNCLMNDFSERIDKEAKEVLDEDIQFVADFEETQQAIKGLREELQRFESRVRKVVSALAVSNPEEMAACFVNGNGKMPSYSLEGIE